MVPNLAEVVEADLAADDETRYRAEQARAEGSELDTDWQEAFRRYRAAVKRQYRFDSLENERESPVRSRTTGDD